MMWRYLLLSMISTIFHAAFYDPIYNALVALVAIVPGSDVGLAVIILTLIVRVILLPFSLSAARTQQAMKRLEPHVKELKEKYKDDKERQAVETLELYKAAQVKPFASVLVVFIQLPILLALYWVFQYEPFTALDTARLYSFTPTPIAASLEFLGLISVTGKSIFLAIIAGATQYFQAHLALNGTMKPAENANKKSGQADFQKILGTQLKYVFPIIIGVISYTTSVAIALYFTATNLANMAQEWHVRRVIARETEELEDSAE